MSLDYGDLQVGLALAGISKVKASAAPRALGFSAWNANGLRSEPEFNVRIPVYFPFGAKSVAAAFDGNYNGAPNEPLLPNPVTISGKLEYPEREIYSSFTFGQSQSGTLIPGGQLKTDDVFIDIPPGATAWFQYYGKVPAGGKYPTNILAGGQFPGLYVDHTAGVGNITGDPDHQWPFVYEFVFSHSAVVGETATGSNLAIAGYGDSIMAGTGSNHLSQGWLGVIVDGKFPLMNFGSPSDVGQYFHARDARARLTFSRHADVAVYAYGMNDFLRQLPEQNLYNSAMEVSAALKRRGLQVFAATTPPSTTSSDGMLTVQGQAPANPAFAIGGAHAHWNAWLRDGAPMSGSLAKGFVNQPRGVSSMDAFRIGDPRHPIAYLIDVAASLESSPGSGLWRAAVGGDPDKVFSYDGIHPADAGVESIRVEQGPALLAKLASLAH